MNLNKARRNWENEYKKNEKIHQKIWGYRYGI